MLLMFTVESLVWTLKWGEFLAVHRDTQKISVAFWPMGKNIRGERYWCYNISDLWDWYASLMCSQAGFLRSREYVFFISPLQERTKNSFLLRCIGKIVCGSFSKYYFLNAMKYLSKLLLLLGSVLWSMTHAGFFDFV